MSKILNISKRIVFTFIVLVIVGKSLSLAGSLLLNTNLGKLSYHKLPIYTLSQEPSTRKTFSKSVLTSNNTIYVCDYFEWSMEAIEKTKKVIGRTEDGGRLYEIAGQESLDYILYVGSEWMAIPMVFRRSDIELKEIFCLPITKISFNATSNGVADSENASLINEILDKIKEKNFISLKTTGKFDSYNLSMYSTDFEGLCYRLYVVITPDKKVYLMDFLLDSVDYQVMPAGPILTDWILQQL